MTNYITININHITLYNINHVSVLKCLVFRGRPSWICSKPSSVFRCRCCGHWKSPPSCGCNAAPEAVIFWVDIPSYAMPIYIYTHIYIHMKNHGFDVIYPLVICYIAMEAMAHWVGWFTVFNSMVIFHGELLVITRWYIHQYPSIIPSLSQQIIPSLNHIKP